MSSYGKVPRNHHGNIAFPTTITNWHVDAVYNWPTQLRDAVRWWYKRTPMCDVIVHFRELVRVGGGAHNHLRVQLDAHGYFVTRAQGKYVHRFDSDVSAQIDAVRTMCVTDDADYAQLLGASGRSDEAARRLARLEAEQAYLAEWDARGCVRPDVLDVCHIESMGLRDDANVARAKERGKTNCRLVLKPFVLQYLDAVRMVYWDARGAFVRVRGAVIPLSPALTCEVLGVATKFYAFEA